MNWDAIGAIGEVIGAIGVIATLLYLSAQIRQNTKAVQTGSHHGVTDSFNQLNAKIAEDERLARLFRLGLAEYDQLDPDDKISAAHLFLSYMRIFEVLYFQREAGTVEEKLFEAEERSLRHIFSQPGAISWWRSNPISFTSEFREYVEQFVEGKIEHDT